MKSLPSGRRADLTVFAAALILRLAWVAYIEARGGALFAPDAPSYYTLAVSLSSGQGLQKLDYANLFSDPNAQIVVRSFRPPFLPVVLAGLFCLTGPSTLSARLLMALLGAFACVVVSRIARTAYDARTGLVSGLLMAVYPKFVYYSGGIVTETLCTLLLALAIYTLLLASEQDRPRWLWPLAGVLLGMAALTRSSLLAFPGAVVLWVALVRRPLRRAACEAALMLCGTVAVMAPWWIHNWHYHGRFVAATTEGGYTLWVTNNARADGGGHCFFPDPPGEFDGLSEGEIDRLFYRKGVDYIRSHPARFLELACAKFIRFWRLWPHVEHVGIRAALVAGLTFTPVLLLAVLGAVRSLSRRRPLSLFLLLVLYYTALHMVFMAITRYRVPMEPYLIVLASWGAVSLTGQYRQETPES